MQLVSIQVILRLGISIKDNLCNFQPALHFAKHACQIYFSSKLHRADEEQGKNNTGTLQGLQ